MSKIYINVHTQKKVHKSKMYILTYSLMKRYTRYKNVHQHTKAEKCTQGTITYTFVPHKNEVIQKVETYTRHFFTDFDPL